MTTNESVPARLTVTAARDVAEQFLRQAVLDGRFRAGQRINEVTLAEELELSRGPVREGVQRLVSEGLLVQVRNKGAFVVTIGADELRDLYEARVAVEQRAVTLVARHRSFEQMTELVRLLEQTDSFLAPEAPYPQDLDFHGVIIEMAGNRSLQRLARDVQTRIRLARVRSSQDPVRAPQALGEHRDIVQAIIDGDAGVASGLMETHLFRSRENALAHLPAPVEDGVTAVKSARGYMGK